MHTLAIKKEFSLSKVVTVFVPEAVGKVSLLLPQSRQVQPCGKQRPGFQKALWDLQSLKESKVEMFVTGWGILLLPDAPLPLSLSFWFLKFALELVEENT